MKLGAKRQIKYQFKPVEFVRNLNNITGTELERVADPGTLDNLLEQLNPDYLASLKIKMINGLIRQKVLNRFRLFNQYYLIAIDATGHLVFEQRHCEHCLTMKQKGVVYYYHNVLEAKVITENGLSLSLVTEFIENKDGATKQDCEINAFKRLTKKLKKVFPQLRICLTLDSLYAAGPIFDICEEYNWKYIISFKEGSMPATYEEYSSLKELCPDNTAYYQNEKEKLTRQYNWVTDIEYQKHKLNVLELKETKPDKKKDKKKILKTTKFVWLTNFRPDKNNHKEISQGGRLRWKIENEGYNMQKNGGYNLEHAYSQDEVSAKNFYHLLQIAHNINQLIEKGSLIRDQIKTVFGSIRNVARQLLENFRTKFVETKEIQELLSQPFQIRFDWPVNSS